MATVSQQYSETSLQVQAGKRICKPWLCTLLIVVADVSALAFVIASSVIVRLALGGDYKLSLYGRLWPLLGLFVEIYAISGLYPGIVFNAVREIRRITTSVTVFFLIIAVLAFALRVSDTYSRMVFFAAWIASLLAAPLARYCVRRCFGGKSWWGYPTVVFGSGETARNLVRTLQNEPHLGLRVHFIFDDDPVRLSVRGIPVYERLHVDPQIKSEANISHFIIAKPEASREELLQLVEFHARSFRHVFIVPDLCGLSSLSIEAQDLCRLLTLEVRRSLLRPSASAAKRALDLGLAITAGALLFPLFLLILLLVKLESRGPVFYLQSRIGRAGHPFHIWKFRTMVRDADRILQDYLDTDPEFRREWARDQKLKNDPRITAIGRFLRKTSLDELPQIWNVLKGEMSLVGPRPIVSDEISKYGKDFLLYKQVLPGITGLWQISGRNDLSYPERVALDSYYVRNWSPWFDVYVLGRTLKAVLKESGAY